LRKFGGVKTNSAGVDMSGMANCDNCGAALSADADWCGQCYAVRQRAAASASASAASTGTSIMSPARTVAAKAPAPPTVKTRWRKTGTTFGPLGRVLATIGLVVPFVFFVVIGVLTGGFTLVGAVIWGFVIMPWGLRDTWKAGQLPAR
jgi:hypothetical protein